jgi:putative transcriptional regulator
MKPIYAALLILLGISSAVAQELEAGSLLVATDELRDPRFTRTVILLLHFADDGALGVAINRPTQVDATESFPSMPFLSGYEGNVYFGGPLAPANLVTLLRIPDAGDRELRPLIDDIYVSADPDLLDELVDSAATDETLRVYAGHAGWDSGQLEAEISAGHWRVAPADAETIFSADPLALWAELRAPETELMVFQPDSRSTIAAR